MLLAVDCNFYFIFAMIIRFTLIDGLDLTSEDKTTTKISKLNNQPSLAANTKKWLQHMMFDNPFWHMRICGKHHPTVHNAACG